MLAQGGGLRTEMGQKEKSEEDERHDEAVVF